MGKFLADEISELVSKPANRDYDIEDNDIGVFEHQEAGSSDDESVGIEDDVNEIKKDTVNAHYLDVGKSKLREESTELKDSKYKGTKGSRKELFDDDSQVEREDDEEEKEESDSVPLTAESEDELISEEEEEEEEEDSDSEFKRERLAKLVQQETKRAVYKLSEATQRDAAKGLSILEQFKLFDSMIDVRMKLQKAVTSANTLPLTKESWEHYEQLSPDTDKLLKQTKNLWEKILGQMLEFRTEFQVHEHISQTTEKVNTGNKNKRSISEMKKNTAHLDEELKGYRSAVLNKWSTKVTSASGNSALNSMKFKAINQPTDIQVDNQLADMKRLVKRTCLSRRNTIPLRFQEDFKNGKLLHLQNAATENSAGGPVEDEENLDIPKNYDPRRKDNNSIDTAENPYIFDDEDFYRVLLNDMVDKKILHAKNSQGNGANIAITSRSNNKLKKNVDTKASKGRKLNYSVQDSIANYEAPMNSGYKWSDEQIDEFFAGLLGQKVNFNESEEEEDEQQNGAELEAIKNDDIQIFG